MSMESSPGSKKVLLGLDLPALQELTVHAGQPAFRAAQLLAWLYKNPVDSFSTMSNLPLAYREWLDQHCQIGRVAPGNVDISTDGTKKYLFQAGPSRFVEAAYIPEDERATLCLSTQVGCKMGCAFCATARQGFQSQLSAGQILNQYLGLPERAMVSNLVFMGMGEPMDNLDAVMASLRIFTDPVGMAFSPRRITVSTVGVIPAMRRFLIETDCHLAISLHSPFEDERRSLMPVQQVYPIGEVIEVLKGHDFSGQRRLSFEYILFAGINDSMRHARELLRLLNGLRCRINLIHYHSVPGAALQGSSETVMEEFQNFLKDKGMIVTIRRSRGLDIQAACGLLSTRELVQKRDEDF